MAVGGSGEDKWLQRKIPGIHWPSVSFLVIWDFGERSRLGTKRRGFC